MNFWHAERVNVGRDSDDREQIRILSQQLTPDLVRPPASAPGICPRCSTWTPASEASGAQELGVQQAWVLADDPNGTSRSGSLCENCVEAKVALNREPLAVSVISLYRKPSSLRDVLTRYKGRDDEDDAFDPQCVRVVRSMLGRYLLEHGDRLLAVAGGIDGIVVVPSTQRPPPHPLENLVDSLDLDLPRWSMLERGTGTLGFRQPNRDGYRVTTSRESSRVLLIDDVYTTGARLNSAAAALNQAGHDTVASLILARRINTNYATEATQLWTSATTGKFDWLTSPKTVAS